MQASTNTGAPALNPLQAHTRLLSAGKPATPHQPPKRHHKAATGLQWLTGSDGNTTAYQHDKPVAWIITGYHRSRETGLLCEFVDVAYKRKTANGINMETADFLTLEEAVQFITSLFGGAQ